MSDLEVTPVEEIDPELETAVDTAPALTETAPEYVLYGGKGGVGKTTMAAATGLSSARSDTRTLVISTDPAHSLSDTYATDIGSEPTPVTDELPLWAVEIDPEQAVEDGATAFGRAVDTQSMDAEMAGPFDDDAFDPMDAMLGGAMPGADEAVAMQKLIEYLDDDRFDRVIVDTAPTGHTLRLLRLPELLDSMVGRVFTLRERLTGMFDSITGLFGDEDPAEEPQLQDLKELRTGIERLRTVLQDPARTDFRIVMVPETMSVFESRRLREQLREFSIPVSTIVVNKVMEPLASVTDDVESDAVLSPNIENCSFCSQRWDVQQRALSDAQDLFMEHDVKRVPLLAEEVRGPRVLQVVAACLHS